MIAIREWKIATKPSGPRYSFRNTMKVKTCQTQLFYFCQLCTQIIEIYEDYSWERFCVSIHWEPDAELADAELVQFWEQHTKSHHFWNQTTFWNKNARCKPFKTHDAFGNINAAKF